MYRKEIKRLIPVLILILAAPLAGCGKDTYTAERAFWRVNNIGMKVIENPKASPPSELERAIKLYENFAKEYPKSPLAPQAHFAVARLFVAKEDFVQARTYYAQMNEIYKDAPDILADVGFCVGNTYEVEGLWDRALPEYKRVMQEFPLSKRSIELPFYIIDYYKSKKNPQRLEEAHQSAVTHYQNIIKINPNDKVAYACKGLIARVYLDQQKWDEALNYFRVITGERYKGFPGQEEHIFTIALIYQNQMKDKDNATKYLERLIKEYPRSRFAKPAKDLIKQINK